MKKIEILPLSTEAKKRLSTFAGQYRRMGRLFIEIVSFDGSRLIVRAEQKERVGEKTLSKAEIEQRVRAMFEGEIPPEWKLTVSAVNYDRADIDAVDAEWLRWNGSDYAPSTLNPIRVYPNPRSASCSTVTVP